MPTKRTKVTRNPKHRVTGAAVAAFKANDRELLAAELRLPPWWPSPIDTDTDEPTPGTAYAAAWPDSRALRRELEVACAD